MRDGTMQSGKIYILKWIKVIAVLKPASETQINLSSMVCVGGGGGSPWMKWFRLTDLREGKSMGGVNERAGGDSCNHMSCD